MNASTGKFRSFTVVGPAYTDYRGTQGEPPWDPPERVQPWEEVEAETAAKAKAKVIRTGDWVDVCFGGDPKESPFKHVTAILKPACYGEHETEASRRIEALGNKYTEEQFWAAQEGICAKCDRYLRNVDVAVERLNARYKWTD